MTQERSDRYYVIPTNKDLDLKKAAASVEIMRLKGLFPTTEYIHMFPAGHEEAPLNGVPCIYDGGFAAVYQQRKGRDIDSDEF